ncbi:MAG: prepilin-type N-terminal cleavage/methylation domain-containing protein [Planctomycetales bacterium]|nr:prepilin-type N-terminal cleavage/methylation domain-containing protein [Planctomycetales bacterium]
MLNTTREQRSRPNGFTLVELLVVMAVLVVLAGITLPTIKGLMHDQKVTAAARMVKAHVQSAQARAIATGRPVAVILERSANATNTVSRLSIGQVFPPYEGDTTGTVGTLADTKGYNSTTFQFEAGLSDGFYDQITVPLANASLLSAGVVGPGDFIQIGERQNIYLIESVNGGVISFINPPYAQDAAGRQWSAQEEQLPAMANADARFRVYRKPTKSYLQTTVLPRGTCVDLTASGIGQSGNDFFSSAATPGPVMIVFNEQGGVAYLTDGLSPPATSSSLIHLLVGRTEQVSLSATPEVRNPDDASTFDANVNDLSSSWLSINPYSGAIYSSSLQAGSEGSTLATRLPIARAFATNAVTQSEN